MDEKDYELNLEDIMKEFGSGAEDEPESMEEALSQMPIAQEPPLEERLRALLGMDGEEQTEEENPVEQILAPQEELPELEEILQEQWLSETPMDQAEEDVKPYVPASEKPAVSSKTLRVDPEEIKAALKAQEATADATIRFEPLADAATPEAMTAGTIRFEPLTDKAEPEPTADGTIRFDPAELGENKEAESETEPETKQEIPEGAEPFSSQWEPQYDEPMGEYVPPEPLVFRPKSRLGELKRKLIAGPERRYYALVEQGLGKLQAGIFLSVLVVILSFVAIGMHSFGLVQEERMRLLVFGELFAMMLSALIGSGRMLDGFAGLFKGKFTPDTILALSFVICMVDGVFCLRDVRVPFCAAFCLEMTMSIWAEYQRRNVEMGEMDTLRKAVRLNRVAKAPNCYEGRPGFFVTNGEVEDFMDVYQEPTTPNRIMSVYCLIAFLAGAVIAVVAGMAKGLTVGLQTWSAAMLAAMPASAFICQTRPMAVLESRLHKLGVVLCGWKGIQEMSGAAAIPLTDTDLFPQGSVKINGVKFYSRRDPDQIIAYAAAIMDCTGNTLTPLFSQLLESRNGRHYEAETFRSYETGGAGGEVCGESVLLGSATFLQDMGVDIPEGTRVSQAVYVAVDGELCGVFALAFGKLKGVTAGLGTLCGYRGLTPVLVSDNFLISEGFLRSKFSVNTRRVAFPTGKERQAVESWTPNLEEAVPCALTTQDGLAPTAFAITGARALRTSCNLGMVVHMAAGVLGMLMVLVLTLIGAEDLLTPLNLLLFHIIWCIPGMLISSWTRHI